MSANFVNKKQMKVQLVSCLFTLTLLSACSSTQDEKLVYNSSYLLEEQQQEKALLVNEGTDNNEEKSDSTVTKIKPFSFKQKIVKRDSPIVERFSTTKKIKISADELPLNEFIHYVMGEVLQVSYILGDSVKADEDALTLNLIDSVSHRKLFSLVEELLAERNYVIRFNDGIYYINQEGQRSASGEIVFGYGNEVTDVPSSSQQIWQLVPFDYAFNGSLQLPLMSIAKVIIQPDAQQNMFILKGKRVEIIKAIEFIQLFDRPGAGKKHIAMYELEFSDTETITAKLSELLQQEGIVLGGADSTGSALSAIQLPNINALTFFANSPDMIKRAMFWVKKIDLPDKGDSIQYFIYNPKFSRASDLGESLQDLIGGSSAVGSKTSAKNQNKANTRRQSSIEGDSEMALVIDERSNSLIFQTTGDKYRKLLPLIKRLDVMPKQVLLEVVIAEVQLTDEFKQGVSFSLTNKGTADVTGGFNLSSGSAGLSYALTGMKGSFNLDLFQTNSHVNILSRPSLLVRDGVSASINVGKDVPTVGEIVTDPVNGSRTSIVYRKTGVELSVTPTINAQGVIIMEIEQTNSDSLPGSDAVQGTPTIFERNISTEVVSESGQTVILGGLISENRTVSETGVPFFSTIPFFGKLFDSNNDSESKSELVIMVTPRIIESNNQWQAIYNKLKQELQLLDIDGISSVKQ